MVKMMEALWNGRCCDSTMWLDNPRWCGALGLKPPLWNRPSDSGWFEGMVVPKGLVGWTIVTVIFWRGSRLWSSTPMEAFGNWVCQVSWWVASFGSEGGFMSWVESKNKCCWECHQMCSLRFRCFWWCGSCLRWNCLWWLGWWCLAYSFVPINWCWSPWMSWRCKPLCNLCGFGELILHCCMHCDK